MELKKRCFSTGCFGSLKKHKKTLKKLVHEQVKTQTLSSASDEQLHEAVTLLGATTESTKEKKPVSKIDRAKRVEEQQMNCETGCISNCDKSLLEYENRNLSSRIQEPESSDSLFSLSIDSRKQVLTVDTRDREVTSQLKPNNNKSKSSSSLSFKLDENNKENVGLSKQSLVKTAVDTTTTVTTSFSGWLNLSHKSNIIKSNSNSPESEKNYSYVAGPTAELKQMNAGGDDSQLISPARD